MIIPSNLYKSKTCQQKIIPHHHPVSSPVPEKLVVLHSLQWQSSWPPSDPRLFWPMKCLLGPKSVAKSNFSHLPPSSFNMAPKSSAAPGK